jgi:cyclopropane fatty-acyl-phospholipid synthase-like methyltransferase
MNPETGLTNRLAYEARSETGELAGTLGPLGRYRFAQTLRFVPGDARSLLDCGCDRGHWLNYVLRHRPMQSHLGIDVSEARIAEARSLYPDLNLAVGYLEKTDAVAERYDVVTALEVIEHIPRWRDVLESLLTWADKRVIVTVPYRERIVMHPCIHCGKLTPNSGHLHVFSEESFPDFPGWLRSQTYIKNYGADETDWPHRLYRLVRPRIVWLLVTYDRAHAED